MNDFDRLAQEGNSTSITIRQWPWRRCPACRQMAPTRKGQIIAHHYQAAPLLWEKCPQVVPVKHVPYAIGTIGTYSARGVR